MSDYTPISCAQHSEYELMAMHRQMVELKLVESKEKIVGRLVDITTRGGVEYMTLLFEGDQKSEVRLDHIEQVMAL